MAEWVPAFVEREYNARAAIPEHPQIFRRWAEQGAATRAKLDGRLNLAYGPGPSETLDLFVAANSRALLVFIHGGYWRSLDKSDFSWLAPPYLDAGISVALLNYALCPDVRIGAIVDQCRRALVWLAGHACEFGVGAEHLVLAGHSAGGHLTAMMYLTDWSALDGPADLIKASVSISGLFDLEPLQQFSGNADFRLDAAQIERLSPVRFAPRRGAPLLLAVGGDESSEFKRQSQLLFDAWPQTRPQGMRAPLAISGAHHLSVVERFADPRSELFRATQTLFPAG
jgi:arylformamidase